MVLRSVVAMPLLHLDSFCTVHTLSWERDARRKTQSRKGESGGAAPEVQDTK